MAYNSISIKPYIKSHLELQREITLIELAPSPYFFVLSICLAYMNMFARFDENPAMTLQVIKETKRNGWTHARTTDGWTDNVKTVLELGRCFHVVRPSVCPSLKAPITTAADHNCCDIFLSYRKK